MRLRRISLWRSVWLLLRRLPSAADLPFMEAYKHAEITDECLG